MTFRSSVLRLSMRMASRQLVRRGVGSAVSRMTDGEHFTVLVSAKTNSLGLVQARFSSSDTTKCVEHKVDNCSRCAKEVNLNELTSLMQEVEDFKLVDVREPYELRNAGEIPNSVNIPLKQLPKVLQMDADSFEHVFKVKKPKKDEQIIFSCQAGVRSKIALQIAEDLGYTKARHYPGGWQEWSKVHN